MRQLLLLLLFLLVLGNLQAQQNTYSKVVYEENELNQEGQSVTASFDAGIMLVSRSGLLLKIDSYGDLVWSKRIRNIDEDYITKIDLQDIISTSDSCYFIIGTTKNSIRTFFEGIFMKVDADGEIIWSRVLRDNGSVYPQSSTQSNDSGFVITGTALSKAFYCKVNMLGDVEWYRKANVGNRMNVGLAIKESDSTFLVSGFYDYPTYQKNSFLVNLSEEGDLNWAKTYDIKNGNSWGEIPDFIVNGLGSLLFLSADGHVYLVQTDPNGGVLWTRKYKWLFGSSIYDFNFPQHQLIQSSDGGYAFTYGSDNFGGMVKTDSVGEPHFCNEMALLTADIIQTSNKEYTVFGNGPLIGVKGSNHSYTTGLIKVDSTGAGKECTYLRPIVAETDTVIAQDLTFTISEGVTDKEILVSSEVFMEVYTKDGCVDAWGNIEAKTPEPFCTVYPIPSEGIMNFELLRPLTGQLTVFNNLGKDIMLLDLDEVHTSLDLSCFPAGIYWYRIVFSNNSIDVGKFVISK